jgi:hypothetical protein
MQDLHFVSSPHTLPLQHGQTIPMRAWWRHWNIGTEESTAAAASQDGKQAQPSQKNSSTATQDPSSSATPQQPEQPQQQLGTAASTGSGASPFNTQAQFEPQQEQQLPGDEELPDPLVQQLQHQPSLLHGQARQEEISTMMASGWEAVVLHDWAASLQHLTHVWTNAAQEFDGVLGFSNGAAAAFLFAAHAAAHPDTFGSLRFVALAGGYVPEPLEKLLHPSLLAGTAEGANSSSNGPCAGNGSGSNSGSGVQPVLRLKAPLPFPSLHMMGSNDPLIDMDVAVQLMECFQTQGR